MRCKACNVALTDKESVRKDEYGEFFDLCSTCLQTSQLYEEDEDDFFAWDDFGIGDWNAEE